MCAKFRCHLCAGFLHFIPPQKGSNIHIKRKRYTTTTKEYHTHGDGDTNNESSTNTSFTPPLEEII